MDNKTLTLLLSKLRRPLHIDYISKFIFNTSIGETKEILKELVSKNLIEVSDENDNYYVIKK